MLKGQSEGRTLSLSRWRRSLNPVWETGAQGTPSSRYGMVAVNSLEAALSTPESSTLFTS